jgi:hypothetical protein
MIPHSNNLLDNFIAGWYTDTAVSDNILNYFNTSNKKHSGYTGQSVIDKTIKDSIDCRIEDKNILNEYFFKVLSPCIEQYKIKYPYCDHYSPWSLLDNVNIQQYLPKGGYHQWHTERTDGEQPFSSRHLVFMTYLNSVSNQGETEFFHQKIKIKPEKGLTVIWPADWTFTHRGISSPTEEKFIVTGWFNFIPR